MSKDAIVKQCHCLTTACVLYVRETNILMSAFYMLMCMSECYMIFFQETQTTLIMQGVFLCVCVGGCLFITAVSEVG